jgi:TFIIF-interacting CTD phosphatase-like protein
MNGDWKEAAKIFDPDGNKYQDEREWRRAVERTKQAIQKFSRNFYGDTSAIVGRPN